MSQRFYSILLFVKRGILQLRVQLTIWWPTLSYMYTISYIRFVQEDWKILIWQRWVFKLHFLYWNLELFSKDRIANIHSIVKEKKKPKKKKSLINQSIALNNLKDLENKHISFKLIHQPTTFFLRFFFFPF